MAYDDNVWELAKAYYEAGLSLQEIVDKTSIKQKSTIMRRAKKDSWNKSKTQRVITQEIEVREHKATLNATELKVHNEIVGERTKMITYFTNSAMFNQKTSDKLITEKAEIGDIDLVALDTHSRITQRNKDTILGKEPTTVINNANTQANQKIITVEFLDE